MIVRDSCRGKMPCESCAVQFSVFRRKRVCSECERCYCSGCLRRGGGTMCAPCRVLSTRPLSRQTIAHLKVRDLQCFLQRQNISTRGCVEKEELVSLCVSHVNSASYRRRGSRNGPFSGLKGLTTNINDFLNSAFDIRTAAHPAPPPSRSCYNSAHMHQPPPNAGPTAPPSSPFRPERFTTTPGGERDIVVEPPAPPSRSPTQPRAGGGSHSSSEESARIDTADCFEVEDLDDAGWEFLARPADPLPNDSEVLFSAPDGTVPQRSEGLERGREREREQGWERERARERSRDRQWNRSAEGLGAELNPALASPARAASDLDLHRSDSANNTDTNTDTASLQDEPLMDHDNGTDTPKQITLEQLKQASELETLNVKQLKELLARNRVEYRGCLERADLLERAKMLWRDHAQYKDELDNMPIEECCKICMAAPLECVLLECGHMAACTACSKQLAECPICRQYVVRAVRVFRS